MKNAWLSATSLLALLAFGGGRAAAAPIMDNDTVSDITMFGPTGIAGQNPPPTGLEPLPARAVAPASEAERQSTASDNTHAQSPSGTYTYQPPVQARASAAKTAKGGENSRQNPGNTSNLRGTIGTAPEGIFAVPAAGITVDEAAPRTYNYVFAPTQAGSDALTTTDPGGIVQRIPVSDSPSASVFVGVRSLSGDEENEAAAAAARPIAMLSATGSATPTVILTPGKPGGAAPPEPAADDPGTRVATTIGFRTADIPPTRLRRGDAASTTLGYTYIPVRRPVGPGLPPNATGASFAPTDATLSATITAPAGGLARRSPHDGRRSTVDGPADGVSAVVASTAGIAPLAGGTAPTTVAIEQFLVAVGIRTEERVSIPLIIAGELKEPRSGSQSLFTTQTIEMQEGRGLVDYALIALAVLVPMWLAVLGFRLLQRNLLRRQE